MSPATAAVPDSEFVEEAVPLLKEYAQKLQRLAEDAECYIDELRIGPSQASTGRSTGGPSQAVTRRLTKPELVSRWKHLQAPAEELARQASAVVEEGRTTGIQKVQLWLRLAEFEHYLQMARDTALRLGAVR